MPRVRPALKLDSCPLVFTLAQVRFSPVLVMDEYIPRIQEALRQEGYPKFAAESIGEIVIGPQPSIGSTARWLFVNKQADKSVVLSPTFVAVETTNYDVFDSLLADLVKVVDILRNVVQVEFVERLGLRYVNLVRPSAGESVADYVKPGLLGLTPEELGVENVVQRHESRARTPYGQLVVRLLQGDRILPPDLDSTALKVERTIETDETATLLDIDHFSVGEWNFDNSEVSSAMWELHEFTDAAFRTAVTAYAMKAWGAREVVT